jgi:hypothetical protein
MWAYTDEEIDYLSSTRSSESGSGAGGRVVPGAASMLRTAGTDAKPSPSTTPHPDDAEGNEDASADIAAARSGRDAGTLRVAHPSRFSWALLHGAAKQLLARLDPAVARLNTALVIVAAFLAYVDIVVYFALKAWALDVDWAALLRACGST